MATIPSYEALGSFYLGREYDAERGADRPDLLLYDSRNLTTHAVCVGNAQRIGSAARSAGRIGKEGGDVGRAEENREALAQRCADTQNELETQISRLRGELRPAAVQIEQTAVKPRKSDIEIRTLVLSWAWPSPELPKERVLRQHSQDRVLPLIDDVLGNFAGQQRLRRRGQ